MICSLAGCGGDDTADGTPAAGMGGQQGDGDGDTTPVGDGDGDTTTPVGDGDGDATTPVGDGDGDGGGTYAYSACALEDRVGGFWAGLERPSDPALDGYSTVAGQVTDGIIPTNIPEPVMSAGECQMVRGRQLFCDPECAFDETCNESGVCQPLPVGQDVGMVSIDGLVDGPISMTPRAPKFNYTNTGSLTHPAFTEGAAITLTAAGGTEGAFNLVVEGVAPLAINESEVPLVDGQPTVVTWTPPAQADRSRVLATVNISLHGGDPVRIECDAADDGMLEIPAALVSELLKIDYSGFPAITLTRQTADSVDLSWGCVDFRAYSNLERYPVSIPGLTSCNETQTTCPAGQSCNLTIMRCE